MKKSILEYINKYIRFIAKHFKVSQNPALQNCDAGTVLVAFGLVAESLNLSLSIQLGNLI